MNKHLTLWVSVSLVISVLGSSAFAADEGPAGEAAPRKILANGVLGYAHPTAEAYESRLTFGLGLSYQVRERMAMGGFYSYSKTDVTQKYANLTATGTNRIQLLGAEVRYWWNSLYDGINFGAKAGLAIHKGTASLTTGGVTYSAGSNTTDFIVGPTVGYDHPILDGGRLALGIQGDFLHVASNQSYLLVQALAALKIGI